MFIWKVGNPVIFVILHTQNMVIKVSSLTSTLETGRVGIRQIDSEDGAVGFR